jgi:diacylglycerol kinase family enzyme
LLVLLNTRAGHGAAASRWEAVRGALVDRAAGQLDVRETGSPDAVGAAVREAVGRGERVIVAAGGDGTVNLVVNALMALDDPGAAALGAVGLGSSNDFHKPFAERSFVAGVPVRADCANAAPRDVIRVAFSDGGPVAVRHAIANASIGITAEANAAFNSPSAFVRAASRVSVNAGIVAAVVGTIAAWHDVECRLALDGEDLGVFSVSNLGLIKNPHFAGSFCYDTPVAPDDGRMGVSLCERLTRFQVLATLAALSRRRFSGRPKTRSWTAARALVEAERAFALETDGEVARARRAEFGVVPRAIRCCR